jgi:hypothetical protein
VMANTLSGVVGVVDTGADEDALRDPGSVWGRLVSEGITAFQTDEPAALLDFVNHSTRPGVSRTQVELGSQTH